VRASAYSQFSTAVLLHSNLGCLGFAAQVLTQRAMCKSVHCRSKTDKRILYVGGLDEDVDLAVLRAAFIPFGEVIYLQTS